MQKTFGKRMVRLLVGLLFFLLILLFCYCENNMITTSEFEVASDKLPEEFDGMVIMHISDLHNKLFGEEQNKLMAKIEKENPDLIVITGDLIDSNHPDVEKGLLFAEHAVKIAPVYFVTGNHDNWLSDTNTYRLFHGLEQMGVTVLDDEARKIAVDEGDSYIYLWGIDDETQALKSNVRKVLSKLSGESFGEKEEEPAFTILLAHEPQLFPVYAEFDIDLVLSGHAHGGQFRIPFVGGFVAPDQGFLPQYTKGLYEENKSRMIVSAGLGNSVIPQRLLNRPELVKITLKCK
nr:metallophosphoesterase [Lachnospiraceae bacterium]